MVGLAATAALGIAMVGAFNLIAIAFFVLFVGLGVDFGIQFSVRYRSERHEQPDLRKALRSAALRSNRIFYQFGGSASETSCASLASA
jgi:predicted RND superfamily exporter protein